MDKKLAKRFNLEKNISSELEEIKNIIQGEESEAVKLETIRSILSDLAEEIVKARTDNIFEDRTGFLGPKFGEDFLSKEIEVCKRYGRNFSIILLDIDFLKHINDNYGHVAGTKAIIIVADAIKTCLRGADVVSRYGGDEFLIILPGTMQKSANLVIKRIQAELSRQSQSLKYVISVSAGIAEYDCENETTAIKLIDRADKELYKAKKNRGNPYIK